jgi:hypothetical protein
VLLHAPAAAAHAMQIVTKSLRTAIAPDEKTFFTRAYWPRRIRILRRKRHLMFLWIAYSAYDFLHVCGAGL